MTTKVTNGSVDIPAEALEAAGIKEGDSVYVDVDESGAIHIERTTLFASGEEFFDWVDEEHRRLLSEGR